MKNSNFKSILLLIISGAVTGALQVCVFVPFLVFVSLIPLLVCVYKSRTHKEFIRIILAFLIPYYFTQSMFLLTVPAIMPISKILAVPLAVIATAALTCWLTIIMLVPLWFYSKIRRGNGLDLVIFSLLFIVGEWLAEYVPVLSFPWSGLWMSLVSEPLLIQTASLLGCHFVSLVILLTSSTIAMMFCCERRNHVIGCALIFITALMLNISYGITHISDRKQNISDDNSIKIMIAQDNVEGRDKNKLLSKDAVNAYIEIMEQNWEDGIDFVLLPETSIPCNYKEKSKVFNPLIEFAKEHDTTLLTGCFVKIDGKTYNAMYSVTAEGFCSSPYIKQVLVPFGEQIPLANLWGTDTLTCADRSFNKTLLCDDNTEIASVICIESIYPSLVRNQMQKDAEVLCISTNDSWFGQSFAKYAHYRHTIMRAVESGKYTLRAGNCGISAVITPWGEQTAIVSKAEKAAIVSEIKSIQSKTLYTYTGDIIIVPGCIMILNSLFKILRKKYIKTQA